MKMIRKQVYILPQQDALLKETVAKYGISEGEIIRDALSKHLPRVCPVNVMPDRSTWQQELEFIKSRMVMNEATKQESGLVRQWQREDLYDN